MGIKHFTKGLMLAAFMAVSAGMVSTRQLSAQEAQPQRPAAAQIADTDIAKYANNFHLAYVKTSSGLVNNEAERGLQALSQTLNERTSVHPAGIVGLDLERDDISFFPFIYWPMTADAQALSPQALAKLRRYTETGGMIVIDTRGQGGQMPANLRALNFKPMQQVSQDHVLTRTFYLVSDVTGSSNYEPAWVEIQGTDGTESVSAVIVGDKNWAGAWAGVYLSPQSRDREMALRSGVNMVMYALMGNYKADQLHVPTILKRLGR